MGQSLVDDGIQTACDSFVAAIATGSDEVLKVALQSLLFAVFNQKWFGMADKCSSVAYSFLVFYSFCKEGHLNCCNTFFSRVTWFGRAAIYNTIVNAEEQILGFLSALPVLIVGCRS